MKLNTAQSQPMFTKGNILSTNPIFQVETLRLENIAGHKNA